MDDRHQKAINIKEVHAILADQQPKPGTSPLGYLLFLLLGLAPFLIVNSNWSEIPIYQAQLPEREEIGALVGFSQQAANIVPFAYLFFASYCKCSSNTCISWGLLAVLVANGRVPSSVFQHLEAYLRVTPRGSRSEGSQMRRLFETFRMLPLDPS